ncbi:MAG TPA: VWA domain-containing protein, partial [Spirochaetota bacterium]|nr:VWA domain-containing protein [Spirochaetota bacterium]
MAQLEFKNPLLLLLLAPYAALVLWYFYARVYRRDSAVALSSERVLTKRRSFRVATYRFLPALRFAAILLLLVAVARPGKGVHYTSVKNLGIDIVIALDVSGSMQGEDFQPKNRLAVAKQVVADFISKRKHDRIGMVVFAGEAYLQCPLTVEHDMLTDILQEVDFGTVATDGTAIGDALGLAASRMTDDKAKSRIILLLT